MARYWTLRRLRWRIPYWISPVYPWHTSRLRFWFHRRELYCFPTASATPIFNLWIFGLVENLPGPLPIELSVHPGNVRSFLVQDDAIGYDHFSYDNLELWHRLTKRLRQQEDKIVATVFSFRMRNQHTVCVLRVSEDEIRVIISEAPPPPRLQELEQRYGLESGRSAHMTPREVVEYLASKSAYGPGARPDDPIRFGTVEKRRW